jgi:phosphatidylethanolamine-binding protein (PEBP) family uncharacterized protein
VRPSTGRGGRLPDPAPTDAEDVGVPYVDAGAGDYLSPPLGFAGVPSATPDLAVLVEDPDAPHGTFVHRVARGIDPSAPGLAEGQTRRVRAETDSAGTAAADRARRADRRTGTCSRSSRCPAGSTCRRVRARTSCAARRPAR